MIRVGFVLVLDDSWLGGLNYFRNLFLAIHTIPDRNIEPILFIGRKIPLERVSAFLPIEIVRNSIFDRHSVYWYLRKILSKLSSRDILLERLLLKHNISLLSHSDSLGKTASIPSLCWIPDFQHKRLPQFFEDWEIKLRDQMFLRWMQNSIGILFSSFTARNDFNEFYPNLTLQTYVLHFVSAVDKPKDLQNFSELSKRLNLPPKYFLVANQFWAHKNHKVILNALGILKASGREVYVVASGNTYDRRQPETFVDLIKIAKKNDVEAYFKSLGMIPFSDLSQVMQHATGFINPSLFEGWNTSVEEAKSLGKPVIMSDIAVHREQNPERGAYFPPNDAAALAEILWDIWNQADQVSDDTNYKKAYLAFPNRQIEFGQAFQKIVFEILDFKSVDAK